MTSWLSSLFFRGGLVTSILVWFLTAVSAQDYKIFVGAERWAGAAQEAGQLQAETLINLIKTVRGTLPRTYAVVPDGPSRSIAKWELEKVWQTELVANDYTHFVIARPFSVGIRDGAKDLMDIAWQMGRIWKEKDALILFVGELQTRTTVFPDGTVQYRADTWVTRSTDEAGERIAQVMQDTFPELNGHSYFVDCLEPSELDHAGRVAFSYELWKRLRRQDGRLIPLSEPS
jgi:hypothetical protein